MRGGREFVWSGAARHVTTAVLRPLFPEVPNAIRDKGMAIGNSELA